MSNAETASMLIAGTGSVTIDWGDGRESETYTLKPYVYPEWEYAVDHFSSKSYNYGHTYFNGAYTIKIEGDNITHFECSAKRRTGWGLGWGLAGLDVSRSPALQWLSCCDNYYLTSLDVSKNTALTYLRCSKNELSDLDVSNNIALTLLYCNNNQLTTLNLHTNTALKELACGSNLLTALDVSRNTALQFLNCWYSHITSLNLDNNPNLTQVWCEGNQLTVLDVSNNNRLRDLDCRSNHLTAEALNDLFGTLHNNPLPGKEVSIYGNPGAGAYTNGAVINGWRINIFQN